MAGLIFDMVNVLESQVILYEKILKLIESKTEIIIKGDLDALNDITKKVEDEVAKLRTLERKRLELTEDISLVLNKNKDDLTVAVLADSLDNQPDEKNRLLNVSKSLKDVMVRVKKVNDENTGLINQSLEFVDFSINLFQSAMFTQPNTYAPGTNQNSYEPSQQSMFDTKQ